MSRRRMLRALGASALTAFAPWGDPKARALTTSRALGPGGIPLSRPDSPVALPLNAAAIPSGLKPETGGTFRLFNYADYVDKKIVQDFGRKYGVAVELSVFDNMDQGIARMASGMIRPDATNIAHDRLAQAVVGKLIRPLNLDYIPNLRRNVWPSLQSPFYDLESRYSIPYFVYATGIAWRSDKVREDIASMANPWSIFWKSERYRGYVGILDDSRQALSLAMLYREFYDINTEDPAIIDRAVTDLEALLPICNPKINTTQSRTLPIGASWLHQADSGDILGSYLVERPADYDGSSMRFWSAPRGKGPVNNDCWAILAASEKPVLAHLWLNHLLDADVAYSNFLQMGYQPPQVSLTADALIEKGIIPENLRNTLFTSDTFGSGSIHFSTLTSKGEALWQKAYARFLSGT